ncbi:hypothetical protein NDU88_004579 [Pleurodeles waltl]|uniref:Uncharacterized protein n=1 Tax=Pleurodeles waltl TaxID=8319 RepID=A0AAV7TSC9_PLEWA|nr:hypothetical protein NDU88_004579 [Pleurodeles waltl]
MRRENQGTNKRQPRPPSSQAVTVVEHRAETPSSPSVSREQLDVDIPELDDKQIHAPLGGGPPVTPQTAEDLL